MLLYPTERCPDTFPDFFFLDEMILNNKRPDEEEKQAKSIEQADDERGGADPLREEKMDEHVQWEVGKQDSRTEQKECSKKPQPR